MDVRRLGDEIGAKITGVDVKNISDTDSLGHTVRIEGWALPGATGRRGEPKPGLLYAAGRRDSRGEGGAFLEVSDDDGATWTNRFAHPAPHYPAYQALDPSISPGSAISGLVADPTSPERGFLASETGVPLSLDAGVTRRRLGTENHPRVSHLALGVDARNLFAATTTGVWRYALAAP